MLGPPPVGDNHKFIAEPIAEVLENKSKCACLVYKLSAVEGGFLEVNELVSPLKARIAELESQLGKKSS